MQLVAENVITNPSLEQETGHGSVWSEHVLFALRLIFGVMFLISAISKILHPYDFLRAVYDYEMVNLTLGYAIAASLPWIEFVLALAFLGGILLRGSWLMATGLLFVFVVAKILVLTRGLDIPCGCFLEINESKIGVGDIVLSGILCCLALIGTLATFRSGATRRVC